MEQAAIDNYVKSIAKYSAYASYSDLFFTACKPAIIMSLLLSKQMTAEICKPADKFRLLIYVLTRVVSNEKVRSSLFATDELGSLEPACDENTSPKELPHTQCRTLSGEIIKQLARLHHRDVTSHIPDQTYSVFLDLVYRYNAILPPKSQYTVDAIFASAMLAKTPDNYAYIRSRFTPHQTVGAYLGLRLMQDEVGQETPVQKLHDFALANRISSPPLRPTLLAPLIVDKLFDALLGSNNRRELNGEEEIVLSICMKHCVLSMHHISIIGWQSILRITSYDDLYNAKPLLNHVLAICYAFYCTASEFTAIERLALHERALKVLMMQRYDGSSHQSTKVLAHIMCMNREMFPNMKIVYAAEKSIFAQSTEYIMTKHPTLSTFEQKIEIMRHFIANPPQIVVDVAKKTSPNDDTYAEVLQYAFSTPTTTE